MLSADVKPVPYHSYPRKGRKMLQKTATPPLSLRRHPPSETFPGLDRPVEFDYGEVDLTGAKGTERRLFRPWRCSEDTLPLYRWEKDGRIYYEEWMFVSSAGHNKIVLYSEKEWLELNALAGKALEVA